MFDEIITELARDWERMTSTERRREVSSLASDIGVDDSTVYRRVKVLRETGRRIVTGSRGTRCDRGRPRNYTPEEMRAYVQIVMGLKALDPMQPDRRLPNPNKAMSTERAIEIAERLGKIPSGALTPRTVNRWAQVWRTTPADICAPSPAVKLVSLYPNHVHLLDFSVCEQYYLRDSDGKVISRPWTYKNKPNEVRVKIWAFALVDHFSTVKWIQYFLSPGESSRILFQGIVDAWAKKDDSQFPFRGAPKLLYADKGSALGAGMIGNLLAALGVEVQKHQAGNPRAKGMVESAFAHFQRSFESELRLCPAASIEDLNARAYNWLTVHNWKAASGEATPRMQKWLSISQEQLLELPGEDILRRVTATGVIRTVDAYSSIRHENEVYGVPGELTGRKVRVWQNIDGGISVQDIETGEMYPAGDRKTAVFGTFNSHKKTEAERVQDGALAVAAELKKEITPEVLRRDVPNYHAMPRTGTGIEVDSALLRKAVDAYENVFVAKKAIADELRINLGDLPDWMLDDIDAALRETLDKERVHQIARYVDGYLKEAV